MTRSMPRAANMRSPSIWAFRISSHRLMRKPARSPSTQPDIPIPRAKSPSVRTRAAAAVGCRGRTTGDACGGRSVGGNLHGLDSNRERRARPVEHGFSLGGSPPPGSDGKFGRIQAVDLQTRRTLWTARQRARRPRACWRLREAWCSRGPWTAASLLMTMRPARCFGAPAWRCTKLGAHQLHGEWQTVYCRGGRVRWRSIH